MTIVSYWWLPFWVIVGGIAIPRFFGHKYRLDEAAQRHWDVVPALLLVLPLIIWAAIRSNYVGDTALYRRLFLEIKPDIQIGIDAYINDEKDPGYTVFCVLMKMLIGNRDILFFLIIATFQLVAITLVFRKYTKEFWTCIFLFVASTDYISWMHNGMRQFIAVAIIFAGFKFLLEKRYVLMVLLILLAAQFHGSALLMIPIVFIVQGKAWNIKTLLMLAATIVVMAYIEQFSPILNDLLMDTQYDDLVENEIWTTDDGANVIRVAVYSIPALMSLFGLKYIREADDPVINLCVNCSIVTMALFLVAMASSGIYVGRLPIYTTLYGYIALPWMIHRIFDKPSAKLIRYIMYGAYLVFFLYQIFIVWE